MENLISGQQQLGIETEKIIISPIGVDNVENERIDYPPNRDPNERLKGYPRFTLKVIKYFAHYVKLVFWADVVHWQYSARMWEKNGPLKNLDFLLLKFLRKPCVVQFHGSDFRNNDEWIKTNPWWKEAGPQEFFEAVSPKAIKAQNDFAKADFCFALSFGMMPSVLETNEERAFVLERSVDIGAYYPHIKKRSEKPVVIAHGPSNPAAKGTKYVLSAIEEIRKERNIEFILLQDMNHQEVLDSLDGADIVVDQLISGDYGVFAIEAMAKGKVVVANICDELQKAYPPNLPIVSANPETIKEKLIFLIDNPGECEKRAQQGPDYAWQVHSVEATTAQTLEVYRKAALRKGKSKTVIRIDSCLDLARTKGWLGVPKGYFFSRTNTNNNKILMMVMNNVERDARVRKEAQALTEKGFEVIVLGVGENSLEPSAEIDFKIRLSAPERVKEEYKGKPLTAKLGRKGVWLPIRVLVNRTISAWRIRQWKNELKKAEDSLQYPSSVVPPHYLQSALCFEPNSAHSHDLDTLLFGEILKEQKGSVLVYDSHELFLELHFITDEARKYYGEIEKKVFPAIDAFLTVSPSVGRELVKKYSSNINPVVLYNGGTHVVSKTHSIERPIKLFFQGVFAADRNLLELVCAMEGLRGKVTLTLQGWGGDEEKIRELIKDMALDDVVKMIAPCGPLEVVEAASNYDVGIINSIPADENFYHTLPNKLFDYMCAGLAVASTDLPPIKEIIKSSGCGITYQQNGVENTTRVLLDLVSNPEAVQNMKEASIKSAPSYAWPKQAEKLQELYKELLRAE